MGVAVRRYIDFLILLIPTPLVSVLFCSSIPIYISESVDSIGPSALGTECALNAHSIRIDCVRT